VQCVHTARRYDPRLRDFYQRYSCRSDGKRAVVAVAHEMVRIIYWMLRRNEPYRGEKKPLTERKLKALRRRALNGLQNLEDATLTPQRFP